MDYDNLLLCAIGAGLFLLVSIILKAAVVSFQQFFAYRALQHYEGPDTLWPLGNARERSKHAGRMCDMHLKSIEKYCSSDQLCYKMLGPVFFRALAGTTNELVTADPRIVKHVMHDRFDIWTKSNLNGRVLNSLEAFLGYGIFAIDHGDHAEYPSCDRGALWRQQRSAAATMFTKSLFKNAYQDVFVKKTQRLVEVLQTEVGERGLKPVDFQFYMNGLVVQCFSKIAFGKEFPADIGESFDIANTQVLAFIRLHVKGLLLLELLPEWLRPFVTKRVLEANSSSFQDIKTHTAKIRDFIRASIEGSRELEDNVVSIFSRILKDESGGAEDEKKVEDFAANFIFAGRDSTATALSWLFYELGLPENKATLEKIFAEIDAVLSGAAPSTEDLSDLPHLRGAVWETLRLHPPVYLIMLASKADDIFPDGVHIPKGTRLSISTYAMGRSRALYGEDCLHFKPERWIPFSQPSPYEFPMFKAGRRTCLGKEMALTEIMTVAVLLLQRFEPVVLKPKVVTYGAKLSLSVHDKEAKRDQLMMRLLPRKKVGEKKEKGVLC